MKKIIKVIFLNLLILLLILIASEYLIYKSAVKEYLTYYSIPAKYIPYPGFIQSYFTPYHSQTVQYYKPDTKLYIRGISFPDNNDNKPPVLIFGCSFAHGGYFLKPEQTIGNKITQLTGRKVYNFAICGCGIQHMYHIIRNYLNKYVLSYEKPEYAIYFYIPNHIQRLRATIFPGLLYNGSVLHYEIKNGYIEQEKVYFPFLYKLYTVKKVALLNDKKREENNIKDMYDNFAIANELFKASKSELENIYPGIKFVIVRYEIENDDTFREAPYMWDVLRSEGFTVINSSDLTGRLYRYDSEDTTVDKYHPSEQAWDMLAKPLVKKLGIDN